MTFPTRVVSRVLFALISRRGGVSGRLSGISRKIREISGSVAYPFARAILGCDGLLRCVCGRPVAI